MGGIALVNREELDEELLSRFDAFMAIIKAGYTPKFDSGPVKLFPLADYLLPGETLPNDGVLDASPVMRRAYEAAFAWATGPGAALVSDGWGVQVEVPAGIYRMLSTITARSKAGWKGAGKRVTIFKPEGEAMFMEGRVVTDEPAEGWFFYDDQWLFDATVDCINQTAGPGYGFRKGMFFQNQRRGIYKSWEMLNSFASCYGIDFIVDNLYIDSDVENFGRGQGSDEDEQGPTTSGFAPGLGRFADEGAVWINCTARGGLFGGGWLFEQLAGRNALFQPDRWMLVGCRSNGNKFGVADLGAGGITAINCDFTGNTHTNWLVSGSQDRAAGRRGRIIGCKLNGAGGNTHGPGTPGNGVMFVFGASPNDYVIDSDTLDNAHAGVYVHESCRPVNGGLSIRGRNWGNAYGIKIDNLFQRLKGLDVDVTFGTNTIADVWVDGGLIMPRFNTRHRGSPIGYRWSPDRPATKTVLDALFLDVAQPHVNAPTDKSLWGRNVIEQSIDQKVATLAGGLPFYVDASRSGSGPGGTTEVPVTFDGTATDLTVYVVIDTPPSSNEFQLILRNPDGDVLTLSRETGNANWRASARDSAGMKNASIAGPVTKTVLAAVKTATGITLHVAGVGSSATTTLTGAPANPAVTAAARRSKSPFATAFPAAHDEPTRAAIFAALLSEFIAI